MVDMNAFGVDCYHGDNPIDHSLLFPKIDFFSHRTSISWAYKDPFFLVNWRAAKAYGKPRLAYHVLYPGEDPKRQADNFLEAVGGDWLNGKAVLDLELDHAQSKDRITNCSFILVRLCTSRVRA